MIFPFMQAVIDSEFFKNNIYAAFISDLFQIKHHKEFVTFSIISLSILFFIRTIYIQFFYWIKSIYLHDLIKVLSVNLLNKYLNQNTKFSYTNNRSKLIKNIIFEIERFALGFISHLLEIITEILIIFAIFILLFILRPEGFGVTVALSGIVMTFFFLITKNYLRKLGIKKSYYQKVKIERIQNSLNLQKEILLMRLQKVFLKLFEDVSKLSANINSKEMIIGRSPRIWFEFIVIVTMSFTFFFLYIKNVPLNSIITLLALYTVMALRLIPSVNRIVSSYVQLRINSNVVNIISKDLEFRIKSYKNNNNFSFESLLIYNGNYSYENKKNTTLKKLNFNISSNEHIAILGKTGSGKSTFAKILMGLVKLDSGNFFLNKKICVNPVFNYIKFGYVSQDMHLIEESILFNITFSNKLEENKKDFLKNIVKVCELQDVIKKFPQDIMRNVGDGGIKVSAGQKQRIVIARALYFNSDFLIFDEATSALDVKTELKIVKNIKLFNINKPLIFITHRLTNLKIFKKIYEIKNGILKPTFF